ncbi:MAG: 3-phosphoserine/phosphohydroxythreonine transaminase [Burkholderiales bacterium]
MATSPLRVSFSAAATALPPVVRDRIRDDLVAGVQRTPLEQPFTTAQFRETLAGAEDNVRRLLGVPEDHAVLFLQGGATAQFTLLPLNLGVGPDGGDYIETGYWARKTLTEASRVTRVHVAASSADHAFDRVPDLATWRVRPEASYLHITSNETADGVAFADTPPHPPGVPLVADMSSDLLTRPIRVSDWGVIYASAQKNIGPAGLTLVLVRRDLLGRAHASVPAPFDYTRQAAAGSRFNTPATFSIHVAARVLEWLVAQGGLAAMQAENRIKSRLVYGAIDDSGGFYRCRTSEAWRSPVNVCFRLDDETLTSRFLGAAEAEGLFDLAGHSRVGGLRASLYNATPLSAASALASFMREFQRRHG